MNAYIAQLRTGKMRGLMRTGTVSEFVLPPSFWANYVLFNLIMLLTVLIFLGTCSVVFNKFNVSHGSLTDYRDYRVVICLIVVLTIAIWDLYTTTKFLYYLLITRTILSRTDRKIEVMRRTPWGTTRKILEGDIESLTLKIIERTITIRTPKRKTHFLLVIYPHFEKIEEAKGRRFCSIYDGVVSGYILSGSHDYFKIRALAEEICETLKLSIEDTVNSETIAPSYLRRGIEFKVTEKPLEENLNTWSVLKGRYEWRGSELKLLLPPGAYYNIYRVSIIAFIIELIMWAIFAFAVWQTFLNSLIKWNVAVILIITTLVIVVLTGLGLINLIRALPQPSIILTHDSLIAKYLLSNLQIKLRDLSGIYQVYYPDRKYYLIALGYRKDSGKAFFKIGVYRKPRDEMITVLTDIIGTFSKRI